MQTTTIKQHFVHSVGEINMTEEAPPKWVAFGTTLSTQGIYRLPLSTFWHIVFLFGSGHSLVDTSQRTLTNKRKREDTTSEFGQARQMAISDAIKLKFERSRTGRKVSKSFNMFQFVHDTSLNWFLFLFYKTKSLQWADRARFSRIFRYHHSSKRQLRRNRTMKETNIYHNLILLLRVESIQWWT